MGLRWCLESLEASFIVLHQLPRYLTATSVISSFSVNMLLLLVCAINHTRIRDSESPATVAESFIRIFDRDDLAGVGDGSGCFTQGRVTLNLFLWMFFRRRL